MDTQNTLKDMQNIKDKKEIGISIKDNAFRIEYEYVLNKISRISSALYMITDHIKDTEPIKDTIRSCAVMLIKDIPSASIGQLSADTCFATIAKIRALVQMANILSMISSENMQVVFEAMDHAQILFESMVQNVKKEAPATLMQELFGVDTGGELPPEEMPYKNVLPQKVSHRDSAMHTKNTSTNPISRGVFKGTPGELMQQLSQIKMSDRNSDKGHQNSKGQNDKRHQKIADIVLKNERRSTIIKIIKDNGEVSITDISGAIKNVSGKTIQRELTMLVGEGILKKIGNKRWSRYIIQS